MGLRLDKKIRYLAPKKVAQRPPTWRFYFPAGARPPLPLLPQPHMGFSPT